uniref:Uncharacterized protein n=2 Tax=Physcomitrium patens TaxID=3218 RepID=A0A7I4BTN9_PHYPA
MLRLGARASIVIISATAVGVVVPSDQVDLRRGLANLFVVSSIIGKAAAGLIGSCKIVSLVVACKRYRSPNWLKGGGLVLLQNGNTSTSSLVN